MQAGKRLRNSFLSSWVGEFPCRGQEAPQSALRLVSKIARRYVNVSLALSRR